MLILLPILILTNCYPQVIYNYHDMFFSSIVREEVVKQWVALEIIEEWEYNSKYPRFFTKGRYFLSDQDNMTNRLLEMEVDCPSLIDIKRLPSLDFCRDREREIYTYRRYLQEQIEKYCWLPFDRYAAEANLADLERRMEFWEYAEQIQSYSWAQKCGRRLLLQRMRKLIGRVDYESGEWPQSLPPSGYFQEWFEPLFQYPG